MFQKAWEMQGNRRTEVEVRISKPPEDISIDNAYFGSAFLERLTLPVSACSPVFQVTLKGLVQALERNLLLPPSLTPPSTHAIPLSALVLKELLCLTRATELGNVLLPSL